MENFALEFQRLKGTHQKQFALFYLGHFGLIRHPPKDKLQTSVQVII
jgi:hypothetical protein